MNDADNIQRLTAAGYSVTKIERPDGYDPDQSGDFLPAAQYVVVQPDGVVRRVVSLEELGCP